MKKLELIKLWMLGLGIPLALLENQRVKWEIEQNPIDGVGLLRSFQDHIYEVIDVPREQFREATQNLNNPMHQLELITLVND